MAKKQKIEYTPHPAIYINSLNEPKLHIFRAFFKEPDLPKFKKYDEVLKKYGVPPSQIRDYLALMGDSSDNVPGVPKVGPKTAVQLLEKFGNMDNLYAHLDEIEKKGLHDNLAQNKENRKAFLPSG